MEEKAYKDFSPEAKKGSHIFAMLSSDKMIDIARRYGNQTDKNAHHIDNKEHFYTWIANNIKDPEEESEAYKYYRRQLERVTPDDIGLLRIRVTGKDSINHLNINSDSKKAIIDWLNKIIP